MSWKQRHRSIQIRLMLSQNRTLLIIVAVWMAASFAILTAQTQDPLTAARILCFFQEDKSPFGFFYASMTDFVVFGLVVSVVMVDLQRQYRPEQTCRILAGEVTDHAVVISFTNVGKRAYELFTERDVPCVVIEEDREVVEDLVREGRPLVLGNGRHESDLLAANVPRAHVVLVACDDLETVMVTCSLVRELNPTCTLISRCYEDDIGEVLAKRYNVKIISTSKMAAEHIKAYAVKHHVKKAIIVGCNSIGRRLIGVMKNLQVAYHIIQDDRKAVDDLADEEPFLFGKFSDRDLLQAAGVSEVDLVVLTEDDLSKTLPCIDRVRQKNTSCKVICRVFHEDAAAMVAHPPFNCDVISTSKYAIETLTAQGAFKSLGL